MTDRLRNAIKEVLNTGANDIYYDSSFDGEEGESTSTSGVNQHHAALGQLEAELKADDEALFHASVWNVEAFHHLKNEHNVMFTIALGRGDYTMRARVGMFIIAPPIPGDPDAPRPESDWNAEIIAQKQSPTVAIVVNDDNIYGATVKDTRHILTDEQVKLINAILTPFTESSLYRDYQDEDGWTDEEFSDLLAALQSKP